MKTRALLLGAAAIVASLAGCDDNAPSKPPGLQARQLADASVDGVTIRDLVAKVRGLEARVQRLEAK